MGKKGGKVRRRLPTNRTFRPLRELGGGGGGGSSSRDDEQQSLLLYNNKEEEENEYGERQCVCLLLQDAFGDESNGNVNLFAIDIRGGGKSKSKSCVHKVVLFPEAKHCFRFGRGYGSLGSTIYRIGGADLQPTDAEPSFQATDVWYCDLSYGIDEEKKKNKERKGEFELTEDDIVLRCHGWRRGPSTQGAKSTPLIVTARGKIYALAGQDMEGGGWTAKDRAGPKFEMFDPRLRQWFPLPDPPFASYIYYSIGPRYWGHAVIGNLIFIKVQPLPHRDFILVSFDMVHKVWNTYGSSRNPEQQNLFSSSTNDLLLVENVRACFWNHRASIYNNKMFTCYVRDDMPPTGVFAHDLLGHLRFQYNYFLDEDEIESFPIPVRGSGLEDAATINESVMTASGYLSHLGENKFCLFSPYERFFHGYIRACTFAVGEEEEKLFSRGGGGAAADDDHDDEPLLRAEDVIFEEDIPISTFGIGEMYTQFYHCCLAIYCMSEWDRVGLEDSIKDLRCHVPKPRFSTRYAYDKIGNLHRSMTFHEK
ncbi:hypothetical protein LguiA_021661 [Lonicera macranthoides]